MGISGSIQDKTAQTRNMGYGTEILLRGGVLPFDKARKIADIKMAPAIP